MACNPQTLPGLATCFSCIPDGYKPTANLYLLNTIVGGPTDPNALESLSSQFAQFFGGWHDAVKAYLLAVIAGGSTDPRVLENAANQFIGFVRDPDGRSNAEAYLWAQIAGITNTQTIITNAGPYQRVRGDEWKIELYLLGQKAGITNPQTISQNAACFLSCLSPGVTRDVIIYLLCQIVNGNIMSGVATPTGFNFLPTDLSGNTVVASWNTPPANVTGTEVWTSTDNVTFALATTVAAPGTTAGLTYGGAQVRNWCKVRWVNATQQSQFTSSIMIPGEVPVWIKAVVTNGGAQVSQNTALAMNTFAISLVNGGIDGQMQSIVCFVPDNLIAALTPLYKLFGNDPWTNIGNNFVAADLTVNGLLGDGSTKLLDLGVLSTTAWGNSGGNVKATTSGGISLYNVTVGSGFVDFGAQTASASAEIGCYIIFQPGVDNHCYFDFPNNTNGRCSFVNTGFTGFTSFNRTSGSASAIYQASSTVAFNTGATDANNMVGSAMPSTQTMCCFGYKTVGGVNTPNSNRRLSFAGIHFGLTSAQAQTLFNAVQALRTSLGGGFV